MKRIRAVSGIHYIITNNDEFKALVDGRFHFEMNGIFLEPEDKTILEIIKSWIILKIKWIKRV